MSHSNPHFQTYLRFGEAIASGDTDAMKRYVNEDSFLALLPGAKTGADFTHFAGELERQRAAFSDFGKQVEVVQAVSEGNKLAVMTISTVTFDGTLVDWGSPMTIRPTGRRVRIHATDFVTFDNQGRIIGLVNTSDRYSTLVQMGVI